MSLTSNNILFGFHNSQNNVSTYRKLTNKVNRFSIENSQRFISDNKTDFKPNENICTDLSVIKKLEDTQKALEIVKSALIGKGNVKESLGIIQKRLDRQITNLAIQAENLRASVSSVTDVEIASEITKSIN